MRKVLVVDDNRDLAENLGELLAGEGFEPTVLTSSREALERAAELVFDAALLDIDMPEIGGVELCTALAQTHPGATFVLMTAFTVEARLARARECARAVLPKPVPLARMLELLSSEAVP